jgi:hypothetical protein
VCVFDALERIRQQSLDALAVGAAGLQAFAVTRGDVENARRRPGQPRSLPPAARPETTAGTCGPFCGNRAAFKDTGGWGYDHFDGRETSGRLTTEQRAQCSECHEKSERDHVYTNLRP